MQRRIILKLLASALIGLFAFTACASGAPTNKATPDGATSPAGAGISTVQPTATQAAAPTSTQAATSQPLSTATSAQGSAPTATQVSGGQPTAAATAAQAAAPQATATSQAAAVPGTDGATASPGDNVHSFPDPAGYTWAQVATGLSKPLGLASVPGDPTRMFVLEQAGTIRVIQNGNLLPDPLMDIHERVGSQGNEQGLLGIALHPDFPKNGFFYVNYTDVNGNTVIARYQVSQQDPNRADPGTEKVLLHVDQPYPNHNGGSMVFGQDGTLYMGLGDGGSAGDPHGNGQSLDVLLGKVLRIDVNGGDPYAIPPSNPFAKGGGKPEIWAYGLRNPWRFSFDRLTGDLYIADVGQDQWEEVDFLPAGAPGGANFGWNYREGNHPFRGAPPANLNLIAPVAEYSHELGCSITGGYVYRGQALPELRGIYLYSDYCSGTVWGLLRAAGGSWQSRVLFESGYNVTSFGQDNQGEIYLIDQSSGSVFRLQRK